MDSEGFLRPQAELLSDASVVPPENQLRPPPNQFTHRLVDSAPFYFESEAGSSAPDGEFDAGTHVVLLRHDGGTRSRVADGRGLYVEVDHGSLTALEEPQTR